MSSGQLKLQDNEIRLYYADSFDDWATACPALTFSDLADLRTQTAFNKGTAFPKTAVRPWLPDNIAASIAPNNAPVWTAVDRVPASRDFFPATRRCCDGTDIERVRKFQLHPDLNSAALFGAGARCKKRRLLLKLSGDAAKTLGVEIDQVTLTAFRTGVRLTEICLRLSADGPDNDSLTMSDMLCATHDLSRFNTLYWSDDPDRNFRIGDIARSLVRGRGGKVRGHARTYTACFARLEEGVDKKKLIEASIKLSKSYTGDYQVGEAEDVSVHFDRAYTDKCRACAAEGCAIVLLENGQDFIRNYRKNTWATVYAPLAQLALHRQIALGRLNNDTSRWVDLETASRSTLDALTHVRTRALQYRLAFTTPRVSRVADHDVWADNLAKALKLEALETALTEDLAATESLLRADAERIREERFAWLAAMAGAGAAGFTLFSVVAVLFQLFPNVDWKWGLGGRTELGSPELWLSTGAFAVGFLAAGIPLYRKLKSLP